MTTKNLQLEDLLYGGSKLTAPGWINWPPFNTLLLNRFVSAKTRDDRNPWRSHTGATLLVTTQARKWTDKGEQLAAHYGLNKDQVPTEAIVGYGELLPVRENTSGEIEQIEKEFAYLFGAGKWRYAFVNLIPFRDPVPYTIPSGSIRVTRVPLNKRIREQLAWISMDDRFDPYAYTRATLDIEGFMNTVKSVRDALELDGHTTVVRVLEDMLA